MVTSLSSFASGVLLVETSCKTNYKQLIKIINKIQCENYYSVIVAQREIL